jgi:thioesterase domain-containing protein/acyl carrier protein
LSNLVHWHRDAYGITQDDRGSLVAGIGFDASVWELWPYLASGASLVVVSAERVMSSGLLEWLDGQGVTVCFLPTPLVEAALWQGREQGWGQRGGLRAVLTGGDRLRQRPAEDAGFALINHYGPTECSVVATSGEVTCGDEQTSAPPIGRPISNTQTYVLDREMQVVPIGVSGELYIGGDGLARGYWKRAEQTAERFVPHPFSTKQGERLYRTGDVVRYRAGGDIEFIGRGDEQVKIRGFRIELGEIESVLGAHQGVREVVVIAREDVPGDKRLVAYVVSDEAEEDLESNQLRAYLKERLPEYMIPSAFVTLAELPLTQNGKVDRLSLPAPDAEGVAENEYVAPRDTLELELIKIWKSVLGLRNVSIKDDFFGLGGHSLLAVRLFAQIEKVIDVELPLSTLFQSSTIEQLAGVLRRKAGELLVAPGSLAVLQAEGALRPFFCVHPGGGNIFCYFELSRQLGVDQPFYAFQSRGLAKGAAAAQSIEQMAGHYIELLLGVQAEGPYSLGGLSLGGVVAFEMSRQLEDAGQKVSLLAILDVPAPGILQEFEDDDLLLMLDFAQDMGLLPGSISLSQQQALKMSVRERLEYVIEQGQREGVVPEDITLVTAERLWEVFRENVRAVTAYRGGSYGGKVTLFSTAGTAAEFSADETMGWGSLAAGGVQVEEVPGTHYTMVRTPHVEMLASRLSAHLREA